MNVYLAMILLKNCWIGVNQQSLTHSNKAKTKKQQKLSTIFRSKIVYGDIRVTVTLICFIISNMNIRHIGLLTLLIYLYQICCRLLYQTPIYMICCCLLYQTPIYYGMLSPTLNHQRIVIILIQYSLILKWWATPTPLKKPGVNMDHTYIAEYNELFR